MKTAPWFIVAFACTLSFALSPRAEAKGKWVCMKDDEVIKVKGKGKKDKEKACTDQGGVWEKRSKEAEEKQESGSGGAW